MEKSTIPTKVQFSAGGVAFHHHENGNGVEIVLIRVGEHNRWQLPKGLIEPGETPQDAAVREVREETGLETEVMDLLERIDYWYYDFSQGRRIRYHKYVYFYLLRYRSGDVRNHDREVQEARWVKIDEAQKLLTFANERTMVRRAGMKIDALHLH